MASYDFLILQPLYMTSAMLASSSVPEAVAAAYSSGTTYGAAAVAGVAGAHNSQLVYESLQAGNLNHTPGSSSTWWKLLGTVYGAYAVGTTYALGDIVTSISGDSHLLYESQTASNVGHALTDTAYWLPIGNTNRWAAFDKTVQTQTTAQGVLSYTFTPGRVINTLMFLNCEGLSITVDQADSGYSKMFSLTRHDVLNWYDWYYETPSQVMDVVFDDLPPYPTSPITVTIQPTGGQACLGLALASKAQILGRTQWGLDAGVLSYSTTTEKLGVISMVKRANAKKANYQVQIPEGFESAAYRILRQCTDVEIGIVGSSAYELTFDYGFLGQWSIPVSDSGKTASIEFKGLT